MKFVSCEDEFNVGLYILSTEAIMAITIGSLEGNEEGGGLKEE